MSRQELFVILHVNMNSKQIQILGTDEHRILFGDALDALTLIPNGSVDLIFADPPYNIGKNFAGLKDRWTTDIDYLEWCYKWLQLCVNKLKPNGAFMS